MGKRPVSGIQREREAQFVQNMGAFARRDFEALAAAWRPDVELTLPGSSWLAGVHRGYKEVSRCVLGLRQVLASEEKRISFLHEGDQMIVRHDIMVHGPEHVVDMILLVKVRYDSDGKAGSIYLEPDDLGLFDHVLNTMLRSSESA